MPYTRRRTFRRTYRRPFRRTRTYGRTKRRTFTRRRTRPARWYSRKYNFKEKFNTQTFLLQPMNTTPLISIGFNLQPNVIPGYAAKHAMFDLVKIYKWKIQILPPAATAINVYNEIAANPTHGLSSCRHFLAYDYTDSTPPSSVGPMVGASNTISAPWNRPLKMIIRPRLLKLAYETGTTTGNAYMPSTGWVDTDDEQTPHYGYKYIMDNSRYQADAPNTPYLLYQIKYTVYYGFKNINKPGGT